VNQEREPIPDLPTESLLIQDIRAGSAQAFETLFRTYYESLVSYANTLAGNIDMARDIVCDTFAAVWSTRSTWNPVSGIRAYLFRAVRNRCYNLTRDETRRMVIWAQQHPDDLPLPGSQPIDVDEALEQEVRRIVVRTAIDAMPPLRREAARLRWVEQLEYVEIATIMGISVNAVQQHLSLALKTLRTKFGRESHG